MSLRASSFLLLVVLVTVTLGACSGTTTDLSCGEGTVEEDGECVVASDGDGGSDGAGGNDGSGGDDSDGDSGSDGDTGGSDGDGGTDGDTGGSDGDGGSGDGGMGGSDTGGSGSGGSGTGGGGVPDDIITTLLGCGSRDVTDATVVWGTITSDTTWSGVMHVTADVSIESDATLTILPGTKVIVAQGVEILVGVWGETPTLLAEGTVDAPIRFCGEEAGAGHWKTLRTGSSVATDSILQNVLISGAGSTAANADAALDMDGLVTLRGVQVQDSQAPGVRAVDFGDDSETVHVQTTNGVVAIVTGPGAMTWPDNSMLQGASQNPTIQIYDAVFDRDITLRNLGVTYVSMTESAGSDNADATIIFEPGVTYLGTSIDFSAARVLAPGTPGAPIYIGCPSWAPGCSIQHRIGSSSASEWTYVMSYAPDTSLVLEGSGSVLLSHVNLNALTVSGAPLTAGSEAIATQSLHVDDCHALAALKPIVTAYNVHLGESLIGAGESCSLGSFISTNYTVYCSGGMVVESGGALNIDPDTRPITLHFSDSIEVEAGGSLSIVGTLSTPVYLSGDDDWSGLRLWSDDVTIEHTIIQANQLEANAPCAAAVVAAQPIDLENSDIRGTFPLSALCISSTDTDYTSTNTLVASTESDSSYYLVTPITFVP